MAFFFIEAEPEPKAKHQLQGVCFIFKLYNFNFFIGIWLFMGWPLNLRFA